jgi:hypothetical protein
MFHYVDLIYRLPLIEYAHKHIIQDHSHKITLNAIVATKKLRHKFTFMLMPTERVTISNDFHRINGAIFLTYESIL